METLTKKQQQFLRDIIDFISLKKYTPTIRELAEYVGLNSPATIQYYLKLLEKKGYIERKNNRNIEVLKCK